MTGEFLPMAALVISTLALLLGLATFLRAGDWEKTKAGEAVNGKISTLKAEVAGLISDAKYAPTAIQAANHEARISVLENQLSNLATKADVAALTSEVDGMQDMLKLVKEGVKRIEDYMMEGDK